MLAYLLLTAMAEGKTGKGRDEDASCASHMKVCHLGLSIDLACSSVDGTLIAEGKAAMRPPGTVIHEQEHGHLRWTFYSTCGIVVKLVWCYIARAKIKSCKHKEIQHSESPVQRSRNSSVPHAHLSRTKRQSSSSQVSSKSPNMIFSSALVALLIAPSCLLAAPV